MSSPLPPPDLAALRAHLAPWGQEHLLQWWGELDASARRQLATQIQAIDFVQLRQLTDQDFKPGTAIDEQQVKPAPVLRLPNTFEDWLAQQEAGELGERALRDGEVAIVIVAGGQGTRLGFDGPKGTFPIGPITGASLFQLLAEQIVALGRRVERPPPILIMTSPENDVATRDFFSAHAFFGLDETDVTFFCQGTMPAVDRHTGRVLHSAKNVIATSPNGHGGILQALVKEGHLARLKSRGVRQLFYCQVDNPLVKMADAVFLGQHLAAQADVSVKIVTKIDDRDPLGNLVTDAGRTRLIEYSELPAAAAQRRTATGELELWAGSIAIHCFSVDFLKRLMTEQAGLPFHRAFKRVPFLDAAGLLVHPDEPNAIKFEMFIFDALPLAEKVLVVETSRHEEFEPLKNATGTYSPESVRQALSNLYAGWLNHAGVAVARRADGGAAAALEISPLLAASAEELRARLPPLEPVAGPLYLGPQHEAPTAETQ